MLNILYTLQTFFFKENATKLKIIENLSKKSSKSRLKYSQPYFKAYKKLITKLNKTIWSSYCVYFRAVFSIELRR